MNPRAIDVQVRNPQNLKLQALQALQPRPKPISATPSGGLEHLRRDARAERGFGLSGNLGAQYLYVEDHTPRMIVGT